MYVYARDPSRTLWVLFSKDLTTGVYTRLCSYRTNPKFFGYKKIKWPEQYENVPLTEDIKIIQESH